MAGQDEELRRTLAGNQAEFQAALARTLIESGRTPRDAAAQAAAIVDVCDGAVVRFLLHAESPSPQAIARAAADGLAALE